VKPVSDILWTLVRWTLPLSVAAVIITVALNSHRIGEELRRRERALLEIAVDFTASAARRGLMDAPDPRLAALVVYGAAERLYYEAITGAEVQDPAGAAREVVRMVSRAFGMPSPPSVRLTGAGTDR
jgi:hypothetical protein